MSRAYRKYISKNVSFMSKKRLDSQNIQSYVKINKERLRELLIVMKRWTEWDSLRKNEKTDITIYLCIKYKAKKNLFLFSFMSWLNNMIMV